MKPTAMHRLIPLATALCLTCVSAASLAADPTTDKAYREGYEAGYKAALEAAQKTAAGKVTDSVPADTLGVGPISALPPAAVGPTDNTTGPGDWWNHSALLYPKIEDNLRHHLEVQLSGATLTGNETGSRWRGSGKLFSRTGRWTNELIGALDKRDIQQAGGPGEKKDYRMLQDSLRYDLTNQWYVSGGVILERDDASLIDNRTTWIAGPGYYWLDSDAFRLNTFLGLGRLDETYMSSVQKDVGVSERSSNLLYFYETFEWRFAKEWGLRQGFRLMQDLDTSGRYVPNFRPDNSNPYGYMAGSWVKRYRYVTSVDLDYSLNPRSKLTLGLEHRFDSNPWPDVISRDTVKRLMLNIMF
jgi:hypothetical protein